jgi:hypothetical protein
MMAGKFFHIGSRIDKYDLFTFIIPLNLLIYSNVEADFAFVEKGDELLENLNRGTLLTKEVVIVFLQQLKQYVWLIGKILLIKMILLNSPHTLLLVRVWTWKTLMMPEKLGRCCKMSFCF